MKCDILTLFPEMVSPVLQQSILKKAQEKRLLEVRVHNLRDYLSDRHKVADDCPYGGGPGMVLKPEPFFMAVEKLEKDPEGVRLILTTPRGKLFDQKMGHMLSRESRRIAFLCGHYEGIDERVRTGLPVEEVSIGDYILTGGELAALVMIDASVRLIPGVVGDPSSLEEESFSEGDAQGGCLLDYPHYTRPVEFKGMRVPSVLLSGDHKAIRLWRRKQSLRLTVEKRPDLLQKARLTDEDRGILVEVRKELTRGDT